MNPKMHCVSLTEIWHGISIVASDKRKLSDEGSELNMIDPYLDGPL